jgi:hypothetical protein
MLRSGAVPTNDSGATHRATGGPVGVSRRTRLWTQPTVLQIRCADLARPVEAELDHAGGDLAGPVAAGFAGDV